MGQYNKAVLTAAGERLIARTLAGEIQLNITKAKTSNYIYPAGTDFKSLTDMQGIKQTVSGPTTAVYNDTMIQTRVLFSNEEIVSTYYIYNIGLYAMDGTQEVLFCIVTAETPDEMPQYNGVASTSYIYNIQNVVQDAAQLNITVNPSGTATIQDVLERVDATGGNISETVIETLDTVDDKYPIPAAGESVKRFFGKVLTFLRNIKPLTGDITLYVATTGSDITGDGSQANPFKTIQYAINNISKDLNGRIATINVASGSYPELVTITSFRNGILFLNSDTNGTIADTCKVNAIKVQYCGAVININGFNCIDASSRVISIYDCLCTNILYCQSTVTSSNDGIYYGASNGYVLGCKIANRASALYANAGMAHSSSWDTGSINNTTGLISINGAIISKFGAQPSGTNREWQSSGQLINQNGTQISDLITSGLSCTWGTISGGYFRHGSTNGHAMITIQLYIFTTTAITAGTPYYINGFPLADAMNVAVAFAPQNVVYNCYLESTRIYLMPSANIGAGAGLLFNATYKTIS